LILARQAYLFSTGVLPPFLRAFFSLCALERYRRVLSGPLAETFRTSLVSCCLFASPCLLEKENGKRAQANERSNRRQALA
jgi:hypothetical protein